MYRRCVEVTNDVHFSFPNRYSYDSECHKGQYLGHGGFGAVCSAYDEFRERVVAIKMLLDPFRNVNVAKRVFRELTLLKCCRHPCIIHNDDVYVTRNEASRIEEVYYVMEYMPSTLYHVICQAKTEKNGRLTPDQISFITYQLACGLNYLKSIGVMHRDLKPANIGINPETLETKILDFGLARSGGLPVANNLYSRGVGTVPYRAPELLLSGKYDGHAVDMWSLGCILAEMCTGEILFNEGDEMKLMKMMVAELGPVDPKLWIMCSKLVQSSFVEINRRGRQKPGVIDRIPQLDEGAPDSEDSSSKTDCSYSQAAECIRGMLQYTTEKRMSVEQLLEHPFLQPYRPDRGSRELERLIEDPEVLKKVRVELARMDKGGVGKVEHWRERVSSFFQLGDIVADSWSSRSSWSSWTSDRSSEEIPEMKLHNGLEPIIETDHPTHLPLVTSCSFGSHLTVFSPIIGVLGYLAAARYFPHLSLRRHLSVGALVGFTALTAARILVHSSSPR